LRFKASFFKGLAQHIPKVIIFSFAVNRRGIHAKIQWIVIALISMNQVDNPDPFD